MDEVGQLYRLDTPILAILPLENGQKIPVTIASDQVVRLISTGKEKGLVNVLWEGKTLLLFMQDLQSRGERLDPAIGVRAVAR